MRKKVLLALLVMFFASSAVAQSVGVAPGFRSLGQVEKGETYSADIYIITSAQENFSVRPTYSPDQKTNMFNQEGVPSEEVSEKNISSWVEFPQETYEINPNTERSYQLEDGSSVVANGVVEVNIKIPENAEPGYHFGTIGLNPVLDGEGNLGATTVGLTVPRFVFRVPGNAQRKIELTDVQSVRISENRVQIITQFQNTGTVTTRLKTGGIDIVDGNNRRLSEARFNGIKLEPGEYGESVGYWYSEDLRGGTYYLEGFRDYRTSRVYVNDSISFTDLIREEVEVDDPSSGGSSPTEEEGLPLWVMALFLVATSTVLYSFDIKPVYIVGIVGFLALAMYIWSSSISNLAIIAVLGSGGFLYLYSKW